MVFLKTEQKKDTAQQAKEQPHKEKTTRKTTRVVVSFDVGFNNAIYIRGSGANLSWDKGIMLQNTQPNEWVWETNLPFNSCEFKVLINDENYECGENHRLTCGNCIAYAPYFS